MRSLSSRTFIYFRRDGRITKSLHSERGRGQKIIGGSVESLLERVSSVIGSDLHEYEDAVQIICAAILDGKLTWRQFVSNKTKILKEVKRIMLYSGLTVDLALLSADQSVYTESLSDIVPSHSATEWGPRRRRKAEKADY